MGVYNHDIEDDRIATLEIVDSGVVESVEEQPVDEAPDPAVGTIIVPIEVLQLINSAPAGKEILNVCIDVAAFLAGKNIAYGNSALNPARVFAKDVDPKTQILVRIDDKLNRAIQGSEYAGDDTLKDLLGYIILYYVLEARNE
jgi:hypothetical protein